MAELIQNRVTERVDRGRGPAPQVENPADRSRFIEARDPRTYDIIDKDEIARLISVTVNPDGLVTQQIAEKNGQHSLVGVRQALPGTVDVEHSQAAHGKTGIEVGSGAGEVDVSFGGVLGGAVKRNRRRRFILRCGYPPGIPVDRHRARKDESRHRAGETVLEDLDRSPDVDPEILSGICVGELDRRLPGNVEDRIRDRIEGPPQIVVTTHVAANEIGGRGDVALTAGAFVIDDAYRMTRCEETVNEVRTNEPGAAGHEYSPMAQLSTPCAPSSSSRHGLKDSDEGRR